MGIKFYCENCGHRLNVKADLAGKRGICPKCQAKLEIPLQSTHKTQPKPQAALNQPAAATGPAGTATVGQPSSQEGAAVWSEQVPPAAPAPSPPNPASDPIAEMPQSQWYVLPKGATSPYGPAQGDVMRSWLQEGRVGADSMVWRQDWADWKAAATVFPQLAGPVRSSGPENVAPSAPTRPAAYVAPAGPAFTPVMQPAGQVGGVVVVEAGGNTGGSGAAEPYVPRRKSDAGGLIAIIVLLIVSVVLGVVFYQVVINKKHVETPPAAPAVGPDGAVQ